MLRKLSSRATTRIKVLVAGYTPAIHDKIRDRFIEAHPKINVEMEYVTYEALHDKITAAMVAGGTAYDVFLVDCIWTPEFVKAGWLEEVTEHITSEMKKEIFPTALATTEYPAGSGRYYGWPWYMDVKYFFYNEKILSEAGITAPPKTLDELWSQALSIKEKGLVRYPIAWSWAQHECITCDYAIVTALFGGRFVDEAGKPIFNKGGAVDALKWMVKSIDAGITDPASITFVEDDVQRAFAAGDIAFGLAWLYMIAEANRPEFLTGAGKIAPVPGSTILPEGASVDGSMFWGISSGSRHKDAALEFVKFWAGLDIQKDYAKWLFPMWKKLFDNPEIFAEEVHSIIPVVKYQYAHMVARPRSPIYRAFSRELQSALHGALTKVRTPQEALNDVVRRLTA